MKKVRVEDAVGMELCHDVTAMYDGFKGPAFRRGHRIRPEDIVEIRISDGSFAAGQRPSSERELHRLVYAQRGDIRAVIHTHSAALQTFAACRESLRTPEIDAPCASYGVSGSKKLAESASDVLRSHDLCIMANHGFIAVGADLETALARAVTAENAAKRRLEAE